MNSRVFVALIAALFATTTCYAQGAPSLYEFSLAKLEDRYALVINSTQSGVPMSDVTIAVSAQEAGVSLELKYNDNTQEVNVRRWLCVGGVTVGCGVTLLRATLAGGCYWCHQLRRHELGDRTARAPHALLLHPGCARSERRGGLCQNRGAAGG